MIGMRAACLGVLMAIPMLAGCNSTSSLSNVQTNCASTSTRYKDAWACARGQYASYDDYRAFYLATGDTLDAQVDAGQISDSAARASLASGFSGMRGGGGGGRR